MGFLGTACGRDLFVSRLGRVTGPIGSVVMSNGIVFDIKEFAIHDGPGIRTTVFLKGCPLRCLWCHNPEGISPAPELMRSASGTRTVGEVFSADSLAERINRQADILRNGEGGVTFSGGEPLFQADFLCDVIDRLDALHVLLDTSGYAESRTFVRVAERCNMVYFDVKLIDQEAHRHFTGVDNTQILENLDLLAELRVPYVVRVPLIPTVTDTAANLTGLAERLAALPQRPEVQLLPYNRAAGGKYRACGQVFDHAFDREENRPVDLDIFSSRGIPARCM